MGLFNQLKTHFHYDGKFRKITTRKDGYQVITVQGKTEYLHRLIAEIYHVKSDDSQEVNHIDGNPSNNDPDNLEWVTKKQNLLHARQNGLWGENILKKRRFTPEQVINLRKVFESIGRSIRSYAL